MPPTFLSVKQAPHSEQATGHGMHCGEILFTPRCSPRDREFPRSVNFSVRSTVVKLRGDKFDQFSDFGSFSPYKTPKTYLTVTYSPEVTSKNDSIFTTRRVCIARTMPWQDVCPGLSVRLSVCPSACHTPVLSLNGYTYPQRLFTVG